MSDFLGRIEIAVFKRNRVLAEHHAMAVKVVAEEAAALHESEVSALRDENERLRNALELIASPSEVSEFDWWTKVAREALR